MQEFLLHQNHDVQISYVSFVSPYISYETVYNIVEEQMPTKDKLRSSKLIRQNQQKLDIQSTYLQVSALAVANVTSFILYIPRIHTTNHGII